MYEEGAWAKGEKYAINMVVCEPHLLDIETLAKVTFQPHCSQDVILI